MSMEHLPGAGPRWRNLITKECSDSPPPPGELDWIEEPGDSVY
ncbi:MAG TPA: hypothetical protein VFS52_14250 [Steroidobacteraceae bacterium]|jgi:hypothetical protein|nr:hypothetical protein [Steroidobacteraceae bacterium]